MKAVNEVAKLCGVSVRTLHYYDELGLLPPTAVTQAGYRMYDNAALARLQQILFLRELDFPLKEIRALLESPSFDPHEALRAQRSLLTLKRDRLNGLIALVDDVLKGERIMSLQEFDSTAIEAAQKQYAEEVQKRWGGTDACRESQRRTAAYERDDWAAIEAEQEALFRGFAAAMDGDPSGPEAQALVADWQQHITRRFYPCTKEILSGLGELYVADQRFSGNIDRFGDGLAAFISSAIAAYCK